MLPAAAPCAPSPSRIQPDTRLPEQRIDGALQFANYRSDPPSLD
jgi:hypothetical protein